MDTNEPFLVWTREQLSNDTKYCFNFRPLFHWNWIGCVFLGVLRFLTFVSFTAHAVFGCCAHHTHVPCSDAEHLSYSHCCEHDAENVETTPCDRDDQDRDDSHGCEQLVCSFLAAPVGLGVSSLQNRGGISFPIYLVRMPDKVCLAQCSRGEQQAIAQACPTGQRIALLQSWQI